jgi:hypothetical protein
LAPAFAKTTAGGGFPLYSIDPQKTLFPETGVFAYSGFRIKGLSRRKMRKNAHKWRALEVG